MTTKDKDDKPQGGEGGHSHGERARGGRLYDENDAAGEGKTTAGKLQPPTAEEAQGKLREAANRFMANLPSGARDGGTHTPKEGDDLAAKIDGLADGVYRMTGQEWLFTVEGGKVVQVSRAMPPDYGGEEVVQVPNS